MSDIEKGVSLPAHLWDALETMSREMGVPVNALVSQAVFTLARLNGFVVAGKPAASASTGQSPATGARAAAPAPAPKKQSQARLPEPEPEEEEPPPEDEDQNPFDQQQDDPPPEEEEPPPEEDEPPPEEEEEEPPPPPSKKPGRGMLLTLSRAGADPFTAPGPMLVLGRGKHCDYVIDSNRVSREHARLTVQGTDIVLEDLGSSNGTFFPPGNKLPPNTPKKLKNGDEVTFGTEKVKLTLKPG